MLKQLKESRVVTAERTSRSVRGEKVKEVGRSHTIIIQEIDYKLLVWMLYHSWLILAQWNQNVNFQEFCKVVFKHSDY